MNLYYVFKFITQSINVWAFYIFVVSTFVFLYSQTLSILKYNGLNFFDWCEQVQFHLGVLDLDLTLLTNKSVDMPNSNNIEHKSFHKVWKISNKLSLMFIQMTIANNIKSTIPKTKSTKENMKFVEERS